MLYPLILGIDDKHLFFFKDVLIPHYLMSLIKLCPWRQNVQGGGGGGHMFYIGLYRVLV